jgi:hypothetical protein
MTRILIFLLTPSLLSPSIVWGFSLNDAGNNFKTIIDYILSILFILNPILFGLAFVVFFWGLSKFILHSDSKDEITNGRKYMIWGVLALFVLISFRTIIGFVANELELGDTRYIPLFPQGQTP